MKNNFYEAINKEWLESAKIPSDQPALSAFLELHLDIEKTLMNLANKWQQDPTQLNRNLQNFVQVYTKAMDFNKREDLGANPVLPVLSALDSFTAIQDLSDQYVKLNTHGVVTPFSFRVMQDFKNSQTQGLYFTLSKLLLPDTSYYQNPEQKAQLLGLWQQTTANVLKLYGLDSAKIDDLIRDTMAFDELLLPVTKSSVEQADIIKMYNPFSAQEVHTKVKNVDLNHIAKSLVGTIPEQLIALDSRTIELFDTIFNETNFNMLKSWMTLHTYLKYSDELTEELRVAGGAFSRALSGTKEAQPKAKAAFNKAYNYFGQAVGLYYGENYFGTQAKKDVETMVFEMINVYKKRIENNDWLAPVTKSKAIKKLDTLSVHVGYPEILPAYYEKVVIKDNDTLVDIHVHITNLAAEDNYKQYKKAPNKKLWGMPASMVNAYYSPLNNQIVFPAAILQKPYYSLGQSASANFGGIGAVIAHEISHAFDNNGAKFDEFGSLKDWWTKEDTEAFARKQQEMIALFDGLETGYGKCNGLLTVSENIADSGGLRAALEASKSHKEHSFQAFFTNWASVWRNKSSKEYAQLLLTIDVHGPAALRVNRQLANLPEFQAFYEISVDEDMYLAPEAMVSIW